jgi:predicted alpha/beta superfamily hydrolase
MRLSIPLSYSIFLFFFLFTSTQGFTQSNYLAQIGVTDSIFSKTLGEDRVFWVQVPESFNPKKPVKYPVVYVLDGGVHLNAVSTVHSYYSGGYIPEMIIVGISNRTNRTRDLTTSKIETRRGVSYNQESGSADTFIQFIEDELIPFIDSKYPTTNYRTLIGHSYGGLFTINALIHHTHLFDNYLAIDPSLDWDDQKLLKKSKEILEKKSFKGKSLFISLGGQLHMQKSEININNVMKDTSEYTLFARSNIEFSKLTEQNKQNELNTLWKFYASDIHGTIPLPSIMDGLIYFFNWYPIEGTDKFNSPDTSTKELVQLIRNREKKLYEHFGYSVPPFDEDLFNMLGYMSMDFEQFEKSLTFFELNIEYYPQSANVYDSIADYFLSQKDLDNALINVTKAFEISGNELYKNRIENIKAQKKEADKE